jgi:hypothetical protein
LGGEAQANSSTDINIMAAWTCTVLISGYHTSNHTYDEDKEDDSEKPVQIIK